MMKNDIDIYMHMIKIMNDIVSCVADKPKTNVDEGATCIITSLLLLPCGDNILKISQMPII